MGGEIALAAAALSSVLQQLLPLLREEIYLLWDVHKDFREITDELESIEAFFKEVDKRGASQGDNEVIKVQAKQVRQVASRIEVIIDKYMIYVGKQPHHSGCAAPLYKIAYLTKTLIPRHRIASEIQDIKSSVHEIADRCKRYELPNQPSGQGPSRHHRHNLRAGSGYPKEAEVVGFDDERAELIGWMEARERDRTITCVVGMGGRGKTTLAEIVYVNQREKFHCHAMITVSQSYSVDGLLIDMLKQFYRSRKQKPQEDFSKMDRKSLIDEVRNYLQQKRYVVFFDDVWEVDFLAAFENALFDNKNRSRILITTRSTDVARSCTEYSSVDVHRHDLQPLPQDKSWKLFCKKAFKLDNGCCPEELKDISNKIVEKCKGLPLAIVAMGGFLSTKGKNVLEWQRLSQNLSSQPDVIGILALSYDDLPQHLKSCFLYFGIFPEDYEVESRRLTQQWIAEGFVKYENETTMEEAAEQHLTELINRSLVQVSSCSSDGKARSCRVHDLLHEMILKKIKDLKFCQFVEDTQPVFGGIIRRLTIATSSNTLPENLKSSTVQSLHIFRGKGLAEFVKKVPKKYRLLKVLDFTDVQLDQLPGNLGHLFLLRYLSLRNTNAKNLPTSIGELQNLETLDLRQTQVREMPREINKLRKLQHLLANHTSWGFGHGIQMKDGVGDLESLQTLRQVEIDHNEELIKELGKLKQLRSLGLIHVKWEHGNTLCSSLNEMQHLKKLYIDAIHFDEVLDLHFTLSLPALQKLRLRGKLEELPKWIPEPQYLVKLSLISSKLTHDPLKSLRKMPCLLFLSLDSAYEGQTLHFEDGGFRSLKQLSLRHLYNLESILFGEGALPSLEELMLEYIPQLKEVPSGVHHLGTLEAFHIINMPEEFRESIQYQEDQWINKHVHVNITDSVRENYWDKTRITRSLRC